MESTVFSRSGRLKLLEPNCTLPNDVLHESIGNGVSTTVLMAREGSLIARIGKKVPSAAGGELRLSLGDDAAILRFHGEEDWVVSTDAFLEGVHFLRSLAPRLAGYKALARASSDLAAMGARPRYFWMNLALPSSRSGRWLDEFLVGIRRAAVKFGLVLAGGDTTRYSRIGVNLMLLGKLTAGRPVLRSGARPGELIVVSGKLGEAELGRQLIRSGLHRKKAARKSVRKHEQPEPRLALGEWLSRTLLASAMIDISDGLSTDLTHLCEASGVGARIWAAKIPVATLPAGGRRVRLDPLQLALDGGDDYELLFTVPRRQARRLPRRWRGVPLTVIGETLREKALTLVHANGRSGALLPGGWDPFRKPR